MTSLRVVVFIGGVVVVVSCLGPWVWAYWKYVQLSLELAQSSQERRQGLQQSIDNLDKIVRSKLLVAGMVAGFFTLVLNTIQTSLKGINY